MEARRGDEIGGEAATAKIGERVRLHLHDGTVQEGTLIGFRMEDETVHIACDGEPLQYPRSAIDRIGVWDSPSDLDRTVTFFMIPV